MTKKLALSCALVLTCSNTFALDCDPLPTKYNKKKLNAYLLCLYNGISELEGTSPISELTQSNDFMVATVKAATQDLMTPSNNRLDTNAVFTLKNISPKTIYIAAISGFNLSDDQGGSQENSVLSPFGLPYISTASATAKDIPSNYQALLPNRSITVSLHITDMAHSGYTQPKTLSFGGNFYKRDPATGELEIFGVQFNGVNISHQAN